MCGGHWCPLKEECYRYREKPNEYRQSYFVGIPWDEIKKSCDYFDQYYERDDKILLQ